MVMPKRAATADTLVTHVDRNVRGPRAGDVRVVEPDLVVRRRLRNHDLLVAQTVRRNGEPAARELRGTRSEAVRPGAGRGRHAEGAARVGARVVPEGRAVA